MFERFTRAARHSVEGAQVEARELRHGRMDTEHLLLGILRDPDSLAGSVLNNAGMTLQGVRARVISLVNQGERDLAALKQLGIDLDEVRSSVEETFGPGALERVRAGGFSRGHIPFTRPAKKVLELSLREAIHLGDRHIGPEHILLALLREGRGLAADILDDGGVTDRTVRAAVNAQRRATG